MSNSKQVTMKAIKTTVQLEKVINKIKPISITNIYFYEGYSRTHTNILKLWKSETESVDYKFTHDSEVTQEDIDFTVSLANATPLELLTALF